jgi:hypothetical protein
VAGCCYAALGIVVVIGGAYGWLGEAHGPRPRTSWSLSVRGWYSCSLPSAPVGH